MGDTEAAKDYLRRAARRDPQNAQAHFLLGKLLVEEEAYDEGMSAFEKARSASGRYNDKIAFQVTRHAREEFRTGKAALADSNHAEAIDAFQDVLTLQPENAAAARALAQTHAAAGRVPAARKAYRRALEMDEGDVETLNNLSALAARAGDYGAAIEHARAGLEASDPPPAMRRHLAYALAETGQTSKAIDQFKQALDRRPSPDLRRDYALALYNQQRYRTALPVLKTLASTGEPALAVLRALGETYGALDRHEEAIEAYRRVLEQRPEDEAALQRIVIAFKRLGKGEKADEYRTRLQKLRTAAN
jgi:tetratricopeptide (TPR) repeat protein